MEITWLHVFLDIPEDRWDTGPTFWQQVTGMAESAPRGDRDQFRTLLPPAGDPWLKLQRLPLAGGRVHLDLDSADPADLVRSAVAAGARIVDPSADVTILASPGGLLFCATPADGRPVRDREGVPVLVDVCVDVPPRLWEAELGFWASLTGREPVAGSSHPEFVALPGGDPQGPIGLLLQRLGSDAHEVTAHVDLEVYDRATEVARHGALGAQVVAAMPTWTVMRAPTGHRYCLTDRPAAS